MPIFKRESKRRPEAMPEIERATILAGLRGEPCPAGGNPFLHLGAEFPSRRGVAWRRIVAVFRSLSAWERGRLIRQRRERDHELEEWEGGDAA